MLRISGAAKQLSFSQEGLSSMELINLLLNCDTKESYHILCEEGILVVSMYITD
jgi:hypothetical protein